MKTLNPAAVVVLLLALALSACSKTDAVGELEKSAAALEKAPAPAEAGAEGAVTAAPASQVKEAITELKSGKFEDAVTRLQLLRSQTSMTPEQRMALQDSIAAVVAEIYALAEQGDPKAKAAVAQYERMQTAR